MSRTEPLWKVMYDAAVQAQRDGQDGSLRYAAVIRAVADEIKAHPMADRCIEWGDVADWLLDEANRAEQSNA